MLNHWHHVEAPSNIALLKYWGKVGNEQIPMNPSLSFTLKHCKTELSYRYTPRSDKRVCIVEFSFSKKNEVEFQRKLNQKLDKFFSKFEPPFGCDLFIDTSNTFPHSAGIASSASSMAAIAKMFAQIFQWTDLDKVSSLAREFSGSACRSVRNGWSEWGETPFLANSNQSHAQDITSLVHSHYHTLQDWVFVFSEQKKDISSSLGHELMNNHPCRDVRIQNAKKRCGLFVSMLQQPIQKSFFELAEVEAMELHALMMTSTPSYMLMKPQTLKMMELVKGLREEKKLLCGYTLDAGSTVHMLFAKSELSAMNSLLKDQYFGIEGKDYIKLIKDECLI